MKITLKDGCKGGYLGQIRKDVVTGDVLDVDEALAEQLMATGEFVEAAGAATTQKITGAAPASLKR